jgi:tRNA U34 5-methylaminomethyl-2-thiouridine-forming methyltransferase MnmC
MDNIQIITTSDGSHSLLNKVLNETYHSYHGARQESIHVFVGNGLEFWLSKSTADSARIFEVGFGTGLNALLTLQFALQSEIKISYTSIESCPLSREIWSSLNYATDEHRSFFETLHLSDWNKIVAISINFQLQKLKTTLQDIELVGESFDVIYFDAFAPNKQPEMWQFPMLEKVVNSLSPGGIFVTYCAKGQLKRDLKSLGLEVEALQGPPGKKEMVRAIKTR